MGCLLTSVAEAGVRLNDLPGDQWLAFTRTWFVSSDSPRGEKIVHPATFPEELVRGFLEFFTRKGDAVIDPFAGSGTTLRVAKQLGRDSTGIEIYDSFVRLSRTLIKRQKGTGKTKVLHGDCRDILLDIKRKRTDRFDFCITSPPYWSQLNASSERGMARAERGLPVNYGDSVDDLGNISEYEAFLKEQRIVFDLLYEVMKPGSYLVVVTNNVYKNGRLYPLAFDTLHSLSELWVPKDEKIWCQNDKKLFPFGMWNSWIGNRSHHYCLIFRKQTTGSQ